MKNRFKILAISLTFGLLLGTSAISFAQPPPPSPGHGQNEDQEPGGGMAPVGGGIVMLLGMGATYFALKIINSKNNLNNKS